MKGKLYFGAAALTAALFFLPTAGEAESPEILGAGQSTEVMDMTQQQPTVSARLAGRVARAAYRFYRNNRRTQRSIEVPTSTLGARMTDLDD